MSDKNKKTYQIPRKVKDLETGEIFENARVFTEEENKDFRHTNKESIKFYKEFQEKLEFVEKLIPKDELFIASMHEGIKSVVPSLTISDATDYAKLISNLSMKSQGFLVNKRGKRMDYKTISEFLNLAERQTRRKIKKFYNHNMIEIVPGTNDKRIKHFRVSQTLHVMGDTFKGEFTQIYIQNLKELVQNEELGNALGTFYFMLPFIHYQTYYLVRNPNVNIRLDKSKTLFDNLMTPEAQSLLDHFTLFELAEYMGICVETLTEHLGKLEELNVIKMSIQDDSALIMVHPRFVCRQHYKNQEQKNLESVVTFQFAQHDNNRQKRGRKDGKNKKKADERKEIIKRMLDKNPNTTNIELARILNVHRNTITKILKEITNETVQ
ncbi:hypothetical protein [Bacillus cereus]|uniref:hypothetical protein n=1 Tax=Bacillus cereus TaxID=1396 RepID=UPI000BF99989|nr:hypothetical protein [Bacillus cereus]PFM31007.1 hypothetical protein COJ43_28715 [Bacillus cereus]